MNIISYIVFLNKVPLNTAHLLDLLLVHGEQSAKLTADCLVAG